jgi:DNA-binding PadR family transcriptional regulator
LAWKKCKGTRLEVFSGKQATLNRVILLLLEKKTMTKYDAYLEIKRMKGFRHRSSKTVYRCMDALNSEGWIALAGARPGKVQGESMLYELTLKGKAALKLREASVEDFLKTATKEQLIIFINLLRSATTS